MLTASANHVSLLQLDGFIAPDRSVSTVPPGDHREMSSKVVPKTVAARSLAGADRERRVRVCSSSPRGTRCRVACAAGARGARGRRAPCGPSAEAACEQCNVQPIREGTSSASSARTRRCTIAGKPTKRRSPGHSRVTDSRHQAAPGGHGRTRWTSNLSSGGHLRTRRDTRGHASKTVRDREALWAASRQSLWHQSGRNRRDHHRHIRNGESRFMKQARRPNSTTAAVA